MSYQLLIFEPDADDPIVKNTKNGLLKFQFLMDVRDLIGTFIPRIISKIISFNWRNIHGVQYENRIRRQITTRFE